MKHDLFRRFETHLETCRHASQADHETQSTAHPVLSQYAVYTSGQQQQFLSPVILWSTDGSGTLPSSAVQLVTVAPSDVKFTDCLDSHVTNSSSVSTKQGAVTSTNGSPDGCAGAAVDGDNKEQKLNGVCKSDSVVIDGLSKVLSDAVDAQAETWSTSVIDNEKSVGGMSSVPASAVTTPTYNIRRRCSTSCLPHTSEPAFTGLKRSAVRYMSTDQPAAKKTFSESDNLPAFLSSIADD